MQLGGGKWRLFVKYVFVSAFASRNAEERVLYRNGFSAAYYRLTNELPHVLL